ncbi:ATP-dependent helicase [Arcobacter sp. FWKO B]|uniref:ATP-dependent helicase n=1 Tax=Arcobacter sp. FWKO B TaxID=2593672 RepID=UPI0018A58AF3|nr:ATP-dependent helicase [Arcobacter sp. FWKO B]QOG12051.1 ATP-dependent helicase [Arcobacter sp. FWKO B]
MPLNNLNIEQLSAASCSSGHNLIIASAGTGKTSTIVGRIANLINSGVNPKKILLLTFTNKAASEMVSRVAKFFGQNIAKEIFAGTFHSVSYKLLKEFGKEITLKQPNELKTLFKSVYEKRVFMDRNSTSPYDGSYLYDIYSLYLNSNHDQTFKEWISQKNSDHDIYSLIYEDVILEFDELKEKYGYVSFDDLLTLMLKVLNDPNRTDIFDFDEILVDEYQDTNPLQGKILDAFKPKSLFCVGDYDQSIYAFNGADISIISTFTQKYIGSKVFTLTKNYRSTRPILELANKVIQNNERVYEKSLEVVRKEGFFLPKLLVFDELFGQYEYIATNIKKSTTPHNEIAIIFRNNSTADGIEAHLREQGIASRRKGGNSFFDAKEVKIILDIVFLLLNPNDMMAFIHTLEYGKGIGKTISKEIFEALLKLGNGDIHKGLFYPDESIKNPFNTEQIKNIQLGLFDDFFELGSIGRFKHLDFEEGFLSNPILKHPKLTADGASYVYSFYKLMKDLKRVKLPSSQIEHIFKSELFNSVKDQLAKKRATLKDGTIDESQKLESISRIDRKVVLLKNLANHYTSTTKFINSMVLGGNEMSQGDGVHLLSIHASKGLEFKEVYIIDLADGRFPNRKLMSKGGSLDEERRLFYVAVTRARDILYLSYAKYDKIKKQDFVPSIFLKEAGLVK